MASLTFIAFADESDSPRYGLRYAHTLAQALHGHVMQLHTHEPSVKPRSLQLTEYCPPETLHSEDSVVTELTQAIAELRTCATVAAPPHLSRALVRELANRHHPLLFVLNGLYPGAAGADDVATACANLLKTSYPVLVVPPTTRISHVPRRILVAADREPFQLAANSRPLRQLLGLPTVEVLVVHVAGVLEDGLGSALAEQAVLGSGLVDGLPTPEVRGYEFGSYPTGLTAAVRDTHADLVIVLARQRSYLSALFHRSVTAGLLALCPVPVLVLPTAPAQFRQPVPEGI